MTCPASRVALQLQAGVDGRRRRQAVGVDVVAAAAEVVVGVPGDVRGQHRHRRRAAAPARRSRGTRTARPRRVRGVEVVQARLRSGAATYCLMVRAGVAELVPLDAGLRVVAVGRDLHRGPRAVLVEPAEAADELLLPAVAPQLELVRLDGVDAELRLPRRRGPTSARRSRAARRTSRRKWCGVGAGSDHAAELRPEAGLLQA